MNSPDNIENGAALKSVVRREYDAIALQSKAQNESSCCGAGASCGVDYTIFSERLFAIERLQQRGRSGFGLRFADRFRANSRGQYRDLIWVRARATMPLWRAPLSAKMVASSVST